MTACVASDGGARQPAVERGQHGEVAQALDQQRLGARRGRLAGAIHQQLAGPLQVALAGRRDALAHGHQRGERRVGLGTRGVEPLQRLLGGIGERERLLGVVAATGRHRAQHRDREPDGEAVGFSSSKPRRDAAHLRVEAVRVAVGQRDRAAHDGRGRVVQVGGTRRSVRSSAPDPLLSSSSPTAWRSTTMRAASTHAPIEA